MEVNCGKTIVSRVLVMEPILYNHDFRTYIYTRVELQVVASAVPLVIILWFPS